MEVLPHEEGEQRAWSTHGLFITYQCLSKHTSNRKCYKRHVLSFSVYQLLISVPTELPGMSEKETRNILQTCFGFIRGGVYRLGEVSCGGGGTSSF